MKEQEYIEELEKRLEDIPDNHKWAIVEMVKGRFAKGREQGIPEEAVAVGIGEPEEVARDYARRYRQTQQNEQQGEQQHSRPDAQQEQQHQQQTQGKVVTTKTTYTGNPLRTIGMCILLFFFNVCFMLPIAGAVFGLWAGMFATSIGLIFGGGLAAIAIFINLFTPLFYVGFFYYPWVMIFAGLTLAFLGGLIFMGMLSVSRFLGRMMGKYVRWNIRTITGRRVDYAY